MSVKKFGDKKVLYGVFTFTCIFIVLACSAQRKVQIGAYYFDGWTGKYPNHITPTLVEKFTDREPIWGWKTSTQEIVDQQIIEAAKGGLDFFNFCWYYHNATRYKTEALNQALRFFRQSSQKNRLKYCLTVINHQDSEIGPKDWATLTTEWINQFRDPAYLRVDGKPFLAFYDIKSLLKHFGSESNLKQAIDSLKNEARKAGLPGVNVAVMGGQNYYDMAYKAGFDIITGYNNHPIGFQQGITRTPIEYLQKAEVKLWDQIPANKPIKYIPVSTLGWDPRPWANKSNGYAHTPYYAVYSDKTVEQSVKAAINWINKNRNKTTRDRIILLYAWNENGEGAWLTPGKNGLRPLDGVRRARQKR